MMTVSLALLVGIVGIINTMLMSTTERFVEFGVLRTNGWSRGQHPDALVTLESAFLGLLAGLVGCVLAPGRHAVANQFITRRRAPGSDSRRSWAWASALSVVMGTLGASIPPGALRGWCPWKRSGSDHIEATR